VRTSEGGGEEEVIPTLVGSSRLEKGERREEEEEAEEEGKEAGSEEAKDESE